MSFEPPEVIGVLPTYLPSIDADGNESVGVRTVLLQAPLGTYLGWNVVAAGFDKGKSFAQAKQERLTKHDPRLSLEERYGTQEAYLKRVREAAERSMKAGLLLPDDAAKLVQQAEASDVLRGIALHE